VDRRGAGLSDRFSPDDLPPLEDLADDLEAVLDAVGSERAALFGAEDGGLVCSMLAARRPDRVDALIIFAMTPDGGQSWGPVLEERSGFYQNLFARVERSWGTLEYARWDVGLSNPSRVDDEALVEWLTVAHRLSASPSAATAFLKLYHETDVSDLLPAVRVPALVLHRRDDQLTPIASSRTTAALIPGAKLVELPGDDHYWVVNGDDIVEEIEEFLTGERHAIVNDRVLAATLFTDIVGSTDRASAIGDRAWRELVASHDAVVRRELTRFGGFERSTAGDGFFATFDGPARAVRCALAIRDGVRTLGLEVRAGVHTGEVELAGADVRGIAVHIGARVASLAGPSEVLVSSTVKDLVAGSGLAFEDAGEHELKGVPDRWRLYRVVEAEAGSRYPDGAQGRA